MEQAYFDRVTRQTHVRRLLQKAVLNLCQKNYAECAPNLEVDGIICISFPDSPDQHVVKIHEKIQLDVGHSSVGDDVRQRSICEEARHKTSCDRVESTTYVPRTQSGQLSFHEVLGDRDRMQNSYLNEESTTFGSRNPVFPKTMPISLQNNKANDSEGHTSKSKRKMFKVVQRKRTTPDEPEVLSDSDEMPITSGSDNLNTKFNCDPYREDEKTIDRNQSQNRKTTNICESVEDGYVVVKVENFDDDDDENEQEKTSQMSAIEKFNSKKVDSDNATQPSRQWIQLPTHDNVEPLPSPTREGHITIDARVSDRPDEYGKNYFSRTDKDEQLTESDSYKSHYSVGKVDLSSLSSSYRDQTSIHMGKHDSYEYQTNDFQMNRSPQFSSGCRSSQQPLYTDNLQNDLMRKNRLSPSKGSKTLDNLFINKCAEEIQSKLHRNKMEMPVASQQNECVSMIDLQSTSNEISNVTVPETLSIRLNRLISTHAAKEKKYFCRHCGKGFTLKCTRSRHEKTICGGGGEGQYRCHICLKVFTRSDSRCRHLWKTHGVKSTSEVMSMC